MAKFKKGDVVFGASDWFGGAYVPDVYTITRVNVEVVDDKEVVTYSVKGRRTPKEECSLFATEEEAQLCEVERLRQNLMDSICRLKESLEKDNVRIDPQLLLGEDRSEQDNGFKFDVGDVVYGHMNYAPYEYEPEQFVIKERLRMTVGGKEMKAYRMKGHGQLEALEEFLFDNVADAKKAEFKRFLHETKTILNAVSQRAQKLGIEAQVRPMLAGIANNLCLE